MDGRVVVITGATGGLGQAASRALLAGRAKVALLDVDRAAVEGLAAELGDPGRVKGWVADVRSMESLHLACEDVAAHFGGIDVVIAGAGVSIAGSLGKLDSEDFTRVIDINLNGVWRTFKAAAPHVERTGGYLLAISSMAAFIHSPMHSQYTASKAGAWALCNSLRLELKQTGVQVGSLHPTFFKTPLMDVELDGPLSKYVWNRHRGVWKFVPLDMVVTALIDCIERRRETVTVPESNWILANAAGFARKLLERIGFSDRRTRDALQYEQSQAAGR